MKIRTMGAALTAAAAAVVLAACSASANLTVSPDTVADLAEDALEEQVGERPEIDCGDEQIDLLNDVEVACELTDPASGNTYDATVTVSDVDGTDFRVNVQVADSPQG
ncbi:conserved hypothetical protein [Beutenbergia cavernae DSM 12333]|uniref:DUF4333 domain-containing protein n=1 Tax=Beutenbergia cavernae (strain ATCC BAA-8 / DSM 12333 / CCUG 43141 / JCM 11478 / NBRC 16432 / NCIMB 13614 / HKI 0122) TaxID=471853 RepID=C5BWH2_BEUC1|nr:DUF4333 domain-containing protein [Beutenbergia cavernae]ACQ78630.1 conserved hypothetical protein [Beutenbergia cavernae DSM 12333]